MKLKFGSEAPEEPQTVVKVEEEAAKLIRAGTLTPQQAFMSGKMRIEGDMNLALQVGSLTMIR